MEVCTRGQPVWRLTDFYDEPNRRIRDQSWQLLRVLSHESILLWCIIGDFNNIANQEDKRGGRPYPSSLISRFQATLDDCNLVELDLQCYSFTWDRRRGTTHCVEIRLDKATVTHSWLEIFNQATLTNIGFFSSDHSPIHLQPAILHHDALVYYFRYENAWSRNPIWAELLKLVGHPRIEQNNYFELLAQQEIYWRQKSKQLWLHNGDKNTKYFHATASARKRNNQIQQLQNDDGVWTTWETSIEQDRILLKLPQGFVVSGSFRQYLNETNLVLIPKKKNFSTMGDLCPIALYNVAFKVISKVRANHLVLDLFNNHEAALILGFPTVQMLPVTHGPGLGISFVFDPGGSFRSWLELLFQTFLEENVCSVAMTCWAMWKARNKIVWKKKNSSVMEVITSTNTTLDQWKKAQDKITYNFLCLDNKGDGAELWSKHEENIIKINVDAATFEQENKYGFGIVVRNHLSNLITALFGCYGGNFAAEVIEIVAIKEALNWVKGEHWEWVVIETNSLVSGQAIRSTQTMFSTFGLLVADCKALLSTLHNV
uniref:RNase H type-1 domain-containing protein n=1 Tax=Cannabis sativa TaxID=3483 RepID=A0A803Q153_CANSA